MQLGKLGLPKETQAVSCKTPNIRPKSNQRLTAETQNHQFEPLEHSVYDGRQRLGHYARIAPTRYAAYDADGRLLGEFKKRKDAYAAVAHNSDAGAQ
jgi:hypothetical protein